MMEISILFAMFIQQENQKIIHTHISQKCFTVVFSPLSCLLFFDIFFIQNIFLIQIVLNHEFLRK